MEDQYVNICPAYQEERCSLPDYLEKEYRLRISRMSPNKIFLFPNPPPPPRLSANAKIQKLIAKRVFQCFKKKRGETAKSKDSRT